MKKFLCALFLLFLAVAPAFSAGVDYPALSGQVVDEAGVLSPHEKTQILRILSADKDNQVVVAIVKDLRGLTGREYGIELARHWQLGQKDKDNGVLILISPKDRYAGIEVGYGLESILPDSVSGRILREFIMPPLKNQNYGQAALNGAAAVMTVLSDGKLKLADGDETSPLDDALSTLFALIIIYLVMTGRLHPGSLMIFGHGGRGGGRFGGGGGSFGGGGAGGRF